MFSIKKNTKLNTNEILKGNKSEEIGQCRHTNAVIFSHHGSKGAHCVLPQIGQGLCEVFAKVPGNGCNRELCAASLDEKWLFALKINEQRAVSAKIREM